MRVLASVMAMVMVARMMPVLVLVAERRCRRTGKRRTNEHRRGQGGRQRGSDRRTHQGLARCHPIQMPQ